VVALANGDRAVALTHLEQADAAYANLGMTAFAMSARRHRGRLVGGDGGRQLIAETDSWLRARGVAEPEHFCRLCVHVPVSSQV
jgi:hypothetical protein